MPPGDGSDERSESNTTDSFLALTTLALPSIPSFTLIRSYKGISTSFCFVLRLSLYPSKLSYFFCFYVWFTDDLLHPRTINARDPLFCLLFVLITQPHHHIIRPGLGLLLAFVEMTPLYYFRRQPNWVSNQGAVVRNQSADRDSMTSGLICVRVDQLPDLRLLSLGQFIELGDPDTG